MKRSIVSAGLRWSALVIILIGTLIAGSTPALAAAAPHSSVSLYQAAVTEGVAALGRRPGSVSDWSGDGFADVLGVKDGKLLYYAHQGAGLEGPWQIAPDINWSSFRHLKAADWSCDGYADVLGIDQGGNLMYFPHNGAGLSPHSASASPAVTAMRST
ncbi:FG-GAP repeat domain-containing protein [Nonomuraea rubra]|uniref:FG-GAP repeat domain-containing protein n=1 Tax=Nonomuraea rubra TaxID=46180 RepID=UPI00361032C1